MTNAHWKVEAEFFDRRAADAMARLQPTPARPTVTGLSGADGSIRSTGTAFWETFAEGASSTWVAAMGKRHYPSRSLVRRSPASTYRLARSKSRAAEPDQWCRLPDALHLFRSRERRPAGPIVRSHLGRCDPSPSASRPARSVPTTCALGQAGSDCDVSEPVNLNQRWWQLRLALPIPTDATPDERPLEPGELALVKTYLQDLKVRYCALFERLSRFSLVYYNYEALAPLRRAVVNLTSALLHHPFHARLPVLARLLRPGRAATERTAGVARSPGELHRRDATARRAKRLVKWVIRVQARREATLGCEGDGG